ncbi:MAG: metallophosphoesterase [Clostridium sp.]|uniref:metallophosphoesterase n=1 Tax=Clostridium sp. TaxID=1506 RepID=UPI002903422F|nr:metallophosphoesterase [Clostridium sp.]MDU1978512.1 metallophosphoesterase [Clostridium sp.]MDU1994690.1 metallophosphoesterase [Clostridium sp.]MDU5210545.1 metallophosphoesterase [Clostridium sp.]MDU6048349.1 metallophosphoesterase [Clostridium sp.]MDU6222407.1 metallophosphoesterase [Clostridium sp.]
MKKYIILSDLHSNWGALQQLEHIEEFKDENSHIIFAGDYIDGEEQEFEYGIKVLDYVIELVEAKKATALLGNHDEFWVKTSNYNFEAYNLWLLNGGRETFDKNGLKNVDGFLEIVGMLNLEPLSKYTNFLSKLPKKFITDNILVVHAGIDWRVNIDEQDDYDLLWIRNSYIYTNLRIDINDIPKDNLKRVIVTGHTPTAYMTREGTCNIISYEYPCKRYFIDGGCKMGRERGQINVLVLDELGNELNRYILK